MHFTAATPQQNTHSFSAIILAGGRSSRMGQDKALLQLHGKTMLQRTCDLVSAAGCTELLISRNADGYIQDEVGNRGPLAGIAAALKQANNEFCLVLPVDMPSLQPADLKPLLHGESCYFTNFTLPCVIPNTLHVQHYLARVVHDPLLRGRALSIERLLQWLQARRLTTANPAHFVNTNDLTAWQQVRDNLSDTTSNELQVPHAQN